MRKTMRKTLIEWTDWTWNPLTGCLSRCSYCYNIRPGSLLSRFGAAYIERGKTCIETSNWRKRETGKLHIARKGERIPFGFDPTFYPHRLEDPLKKGRSSKIFVCDCGDLWGDWVPNEWIDEVLKVVKKCPQHTFQFLTKNPQRYLDFEPLPENSWAGTTVTSNEDYERTKIMKKVKVPIRFLSIEPLLGEVTFPFDNIEWIIIGAMTGKNPVRPKKEWIDRILSNARKHGIPIFLKNNLRSCYSFSLQQFPH
jgi:protein gp37